LRTRLKTSPAATSPASLRCAIVFQILLTDDEALSKFLTNENCQYVISMKSKHFISSTHSFFSLRGSLFPAHMTSSARNSFRLAHWLFCSQADNKPMLSNVFSCSKH
jgi:hypothetical protein